VQRLVLEQGGIADLGRIAAFTEEMCERCGGADARLVYHVQMAVDEACTNVFEHAYGGRPGRLELEFECVAQCLRIHIRDWGRAFDPEGVHEPDPSQPLHERRAGGLGVFLMRKLMDRVEYSFDESRGNCLTLEKEFDSS
jgi:serine/threonine-protein kinase RsbW